MESKQNSQVESLITEAVIIRADGTKEDLGVIAYYHRNPVKRLLWHLKQKLKVIFNGKRIH